MRLAEWLEQQKMTQQAFAELIGVTQGRVAQLASGDLPSLKLASKIELATAHAVTVEDFLAEAAE